MIKKFRPCCRVDHITQVPLVELREAGIHGLLVDIDNTISPWGKHEVSPEIRDWLSSLAGQGFSFCLVSNTFEARAGIVAAQVEGPFVCRAMKPSKNGFRRAMNVLGLSEKEIVVVGDQMITDVWGANRCGIAAIWVRPLSKREFFTTKGNRLLERIVFFLLQKRGLLPPVGEFRKC